MIVPIKIDECSNKQMRYRIMRVDEQRFYEVDFGDGTFSNDMLPEDIIVSRPKIKAEKEKRRK